jgi:hypothetical protein
VLLRQAKPQRKKRVELVYGGGINLYAGDLEDTVVSDLFTAAARVAAKHLIHAATYNPIRDNGDLYRFAALSDGDLIVRAV